MRLLRRSLLLALALAVVAVPGVALAHDLLDHAPPSVGPRPTPTTTGFQAGPEGAKWEFVQSITTGNPQTDLDFFRRNGNVFASVGTLGVSPNGGGQTIVQLTDGNEVKPRFVSQAPTASCVSNEAAALGLQHDVEASPKGGTLLNTFNPFAPDQDAQIIVDATDANGRCHDSAVFGGDGVLGAVTDKQGGLEIVDVSDPSNPEEIGLTSHVGEAHTVNIDPKRPHIAYAVTSDAVGVTDGKRDNEESGLSLDGFEVVDMSSCMNFPAGTSLTEKRNRCRPEVFRYRYPDLASTQGTVNKDTVYGCHELEVYPDDRLTCASGQALMTFNMAGAFDDRGTPEDFTDDKPRGTPLPCTARASASVVFRTGATVIDCVDGAGLGTDDLRVSKWLASGAPSLQGVEFLGSAYHMGRESASGAANPAFDSTQDIDFNHEAELSSSGNLLIATDERGGGVLPPGASCTQGADNPAGNGGVHFYKANALRKSTPGSAEEAFGAYARTPDGAKAIFRAPIRTGAQATACTAHVFQQIPGQNRIFMAWYSQGTQVLDFTENPDGTVSLKQAGYFVPANANQWASQIFKAQENPDGSFTYWGAVGDFNLGERGRNAIDVYKVTLPPPPLPADGPGVIGKSRVNNMDVGPRSGAPACVAGTRLLRSARVRRNGRKLGFAFRGTGKVDITLFQQSSGRSITGERVVKRFRDVKGAVRWNGRDRKGRRLTDGYYFVRFRSRANGTQDIRRITLVRRNGKFRKAPAFHRRETCGLVRQFKLERPVFGGRTNRPLYFTFRTGSDARVTATVRRVGGRVVRRFKARNTRRLQLNRLRMTVTPRIRRGRYVVTLTARSGGQKQTVRLRAARL